MAQALTMAKFRARMDRDPKPMEKLARQIKKQDVFALDGEDFKRPKQAPSTLLEPWYNKKNGFSLSCDRPHDDLFFSPELPGALWEEWEKLVPLFRYLSHWTGIRTQESRNHFQNFLTGTKTTLLRILRGNILRKAAGWFCVWNGKR